MATIRHHTRIDASPDDVWAIVADAGGIADWAPGIEPGTVEWDEATATRTIDMGGMKIVEAIVSLARGLGLPITVEGIENATVLDELRKMGNLVGQGYFYGRPENAAETAARLANKKLLAVSSVIHQITKFDPARVAAIPAALDRKAS